MGNNCSPHHASIYLSALRDQDHQQSVKVKFRGDRVVEIERWDDGRFQCLCARHFIVPSTLRRHTRSCEGWGLWRHKIRPGGPSHQSQNVYQPRNLKHSVVTPLRLTVWLSYSSVIDPGGKSTYGIPVSCHETHGPSATRYILV